MPDPEFRQMNHQRVNGVLPQTCPVDGVDMPTDRAWWWTWHGATCSEQCAYALIEAAHGVDDLCREECRNAPADL